MNKPVWIIIMAMAIILTNSITFVVTRELSRAIVNYSAWTEEDEKLLVDYRKRAQELREKYIESTKDASDIIRNEWYLLQAGVNNMERQRSNRWLR